MKNLFAQINWQHDDATGLEVVAHFGNVIVVVVGNVDEDIARLKRIETCHGAIPIKSANLVDLDLYEFNFNLTCLTNLLFLVIKRGQDLLVDAVVELSSWHVRVVDKHKVGQRGIGHFA